MKNSGVRQHLGKRISRKRNEPLAIRWRTAGRQVFSPMIKPLVGGEELATEINQTQPDHKLAIWWLGQSGFLIRTGNQRILLDPYLSDSLSKKYHGTDKPHVRISERVIDPHLLQHINLITSSHNHTDHLDAETLTPLLSVNQQAHLLVGEANRRFVAERLGCRYDFPLGITEDKPVQIGEVTITALPSAHNGLERDENGNPKYLGFLLRTSSWCIYHSGDTLVYPGLMERLKGENVDVAFLPINGNRPERRVAGNMNGTEAARLAFEAGVKLVIPHHYHMFEFNTEEPDDFESECRRLGQGFQTLRMGERVMLEPEN